jgi:hypothetical protein
MFWFVKIKHFTCICLSALLLTGCLGTRYLKENEKMLYRQTVKATAKQFDTAPLTDLYTAKTNRKLFGLPVNHLVWMHHVGENTFNPQKFINKKEKKVQVFDRKIKKAHRQKSITNLQYRKQRKMEDFDKKIENGNDFMQWGEVISTYDSAATLLTTEKFTGYLFSKGYFLSKVEAAISEKKRRVSVVYKIHPGPPYLLDSIFYNIPDSLVNRLVAKDRANQVLVKGHLYNEDDFSKERERIDLLLRDNGYYNFNRQYVDFELDTALTQPHRVTVRANIHKPDRGPLHSRFRIDSLIFIPDVGQKADSGHRRQAHYYQKISFRSFDNKFHKKVLRERVFIFQDSLYSRSQTFQTQRQLANLDIFKFVNINYDTSNGKFIANIFASPLDRYSWGNEAGASVTQGFPGPYYSLNFKKRNLFGGLEIFELNGRYGIEGVASATQIGNFLTSTQANVNATISSFRSAVSKQPAWLNSILDQNCWQAIPIPTGLNINGASSLLRAAIPGRTKKTFNIHSHH